MNGLDWTLAGIALVCVGRGLWRGAVTQVFGIVGVLGGFVLASHHYERVGAQLLRVFPTLSIAPAVGFVALFLLTWVCVGTLGYFTAKLIHKTALGFLDRLLGGAIGMGKALLLSVVIVYLLALFMPPQSTLIRRSVLSPLVYEAARYVTMVCPVNVQRLVEEKRKQLEAYLGGKTGRSRPVPPVRERTNRETGDE